MIEQAALSYVHRGWAIIPMHGVDEDRRCSCGQALDFMLGPEKHQIGKHPHTLHGHKDASKEPAQVVLWWAQWPIANVAIVTGFKSGLIVLDVDLKNGGYDSLAKLERRYEPLPQTIRVKSGGGGLHVYFRHPGFEVRGRIGMYPGLDVSADGGKIVAPPSRHKSGNRYQWVEGLGPDEVPLAALPKWLLNEIRTPRKPISRRKKTPAFDWVSVSPYLRRK